jgi:hypothetical protein
MVACSRCGHENPEGNRFCGECAAARELASARTEEGFALLGRGRALLLLGRAAEAAKVLRQAHTLFTRLDAFAALSDTDELLRETSTRSAG